MDTAFPQLTLEGQQKALLDSLSERDQRLAHMYFGAICVLRQTNNPDRFPLAAHGLRELMEKLPKYLDVPIENEGPGLKERINNLQPGWTSVKKNSRCFDRDNPGWAGEIDGVLAKFLRKLDEFFDRFLQDYPKRKEQTARVLRSLDISDHPLPAPIEVLRVDEWNGYNYFFQGVSHHTKVTDADEFYSYLMHFEKFVLDYLRPRTFDNIAELDEIIREGEQGA